MRYLVWRTVRDKRQYHDRRHLNADEQRVPANKPVSLDRVRHRLGDEGAKDIRRHRYEVVDGPRPLRLADGETEEEPVQEEEIVETEEPVVTDEPTNTTPSTGGIALVGLGIASLLAGGAVLLARKKEN